MEDEEEDLLNKLHLVFSAQYFEQVTTHVFQKEVTHCLQTIITKSSSSGAGASSSSSSSIGFGFVTQYDPDVITSFLFPFTGATGNGIGDGASSTISSRTGNSACRIQWEALIRNQKEAFMRSSSSSSRTNRNGTSTATSTALGSILGAMTMDTSIIPACCTETIIRGLLSMSVHVFSNPMHSRNLSIRSTSSSSSNRTSRHAGGRKLKSTVRSTNIHTSTSSSSRDEQQQQQQHDSDYAPWDIIQRGIVHLMEHRPNISFSNVLKQFISSHTSACACTTTGTKWSSSSDTSSTTPPHVLLQDYNLTRLQTVLYMTNKLMAIQRKNASLSSLNHMIPPPLLVTCILHPILLLLNQLDQMDINLLQNRQDSQVTNRAKLFCKSCRIVHPSQQERRRISKKRSFVPITQSMASLHGEEEGREDDDEEESHHHSRIRRRKRQRTSSSSSSSSTSRRRGKETEEEEPCPLCSNYIQNSSWRAMRRGREITALPIRAVSLRGQLYQIILDGVLDHSCRRGGRGDDDDSPFAIVRLVMNVMTRHSDSSSIRLVTVLVLHTLATTSSSSTSTRPEDDWFPNGISELFDKGSSSKTFTRESRVFMKAYSEIVVECSFFDDSIICWNAVRPMIDFLFDLNERRTTTLVPSKVNHGQPFVESRSVEKDPACFSPSILAHTGTNELLTERIRFILQCIGYIFVNRHGTLTNIDSGTEIHDSFKWYMIRCSEAFGEKQFWITSSMTILQQRQIVSVLQLVGILSFIESNDNIDVKASKQGGECWPFPCFSSIRSTYERMGIKDRTQQILTTRHKIDIPSALMCGKKQAREREDSISSDAPILEYINDDLTREIFSYLGYKKMVRVTSVCKLWNVIGNENHFWKVFYMRRFKSMLLEDFLHHSTKENVRNAFLDKHSTSKTYEWRKVFDSKWKKERSLRSSFGKGGWKRRTCTVVGCLTVLSTKDHLERHCQMHRRDAEKKCKVIQNRLERESKR